MATVRLKTKRIDHMSNCGPDGLFIRCDMTEKEMRAAFGEFMLHITEAQLTDWLREFSIEQAGDQ